MEEKLIKQIKTQCPFPLLIYKTRIKYNEVRKASGIAYILLELIDKQKSDMRFSEALKKFGIPTELHSLFGRELEGLINTEIVKSKYAASHFSNPKYFAEIKLNEVAITPKGKKLFSEGAIPTGVEKEKAKDIFYSPVTNRFDVYSDMTYSPIANCFLGEEFLDHVDIDISGLGDYLNVNPTKVGLKAEERMISFETDPPQKMHVRSEENITLNIYPSHIEFTFATTAERAFFDKYYSSAIMESGMVMKNKFKFPESVGRIPTVGIATVSNLTALYLPEDLSKQAKRPCVVFLQRGTAVDRNDAICADLDLSCRLLDEIDEHAYCALLDKSGCRAFSAVNMAMSCKNFGDTFTLPLLIESKADDEIFRGIVESLYDQYCEKPFDDEVGRIVTYVADCLGAEYFGKFIDKKLKSVKTADEQTELLLKINSAFKNHQPWTEYFAKAATELYNRSVSEVKVENVIYKNTVLMPLKTALRIPNIEYVRRFSDNICKTETREIAYEALNSALPDMEMEILSVANVIETFMNAVLENTSINSDTELASKYKTVRVNLWKLCDMLGVTNSAEYTLKDDYNNDAFFNAYGTLLNTSKTIQKYRQFAGNEYEKYDRYLAIFKPIHELLSIERTAAFHPENITEKYINDFISRGKYKDAVCDLLIRLQYDLCKKLQLDKSTPVNDTINDALSKKLITKPQADDLHILRKCRNGFQHPGAAQIPFDKATIEKWRDLVFMVGGLK
ncbi:MAG: hypothetical protein J1F33_01280 [Clostridiales bacterium]|nr:hypothetical protein [Clostridiales bacterium]